MGMIVGTNNRDISRPGSVKGQKQQNYAYVHMNTTPLVFFINMYVHFFFHQYNRYQKEIQEKNKKIKPELSDFCG
jgi:hypothetical protein